MELNAWRPAADAGSLTLLRAKLARRLATEAAGYRSPWYAGHDCSHAPEPGPYRQWREARSDWLTTQRPEDFERMLAAVTADNPPLAADIHYRDRRAAVRWSPAAPTSGISGAALLPPAHDLIGQAVALAAEAVAALTAAVVLVLGAALAVILAVLQGGARLARASAGRRGHLTGPARETPHPFGGNALSSDCLPKPADLAQRHARTARPGTRVPR